MKTLVIEREAVKNNIGVIKERAGEAVIYAVLTGDGQGAGLVELARLLREEGIGRFAVSEPAEAAALRRAGFVEEEILMLRPTVDRAELEQLIDLNVVCTVGSADTGMALNGAAEARSTVVEAHIQIDTGMGFGGFLADEPEKILSVYRNLPNVAVSGICTQLHARKKGGEDLAARLGQFHRVVEAIRAAGFETGVVHAAGSYALLHCADARLDGVRAGSALLGRCRRVHGDGLYRVGYGEVGIEETRWLPKGHTVGSARPIVLRRPTRVAVLPVGYQNGFGVARAQGGGLGGLQGGAGPGAGAPGAQGGPGGGPGRSVHLHPQAQAGELVKGPAGHRAQADDCGAVRTHGGPQLAGLPPGGGAVHRHGPEPRQPRQRPAAHLRQIPPREHCVRVEQQQRRAVRPLEHHRLTVKELSHIPHQAQQRPRACRAPRPQSGEPVLPGGAVGIQHGLSSPAHASLSAPASSSGWRIIR